MSHSEQLKFCIRPAGEGALCLTLKGPLDEEKNIRIMALKARLEREGETMGFGETIPGFVSLLVRYDALHMDYEEAYGALERLAGESFGGEVFRADADVPRGAAASCAAGAFAVGAGAEKGAASSGTAPAAGRLVEIPVCYGGDFGEDLGFVAAHGGLTEEEVIRIHSGRDYRIYMLGFLPGFPYLGGLDSRLFTPRLSAPRVKIPAGSVGIGGEQTGIYPLESPGGWQLIGRTPLTLFSPERGGALPYKPGDRIRFVPISPQEYARIRDTQEGGENHAV